jgi:2-dehydro-3-deoxygalactonokinase
MMIEQILSCDWGTSSFRLRLINTSDHSVLAEISDDRGVAAIYNEWLQSSLAENERLSFYKNVLLSQIKKLNNGPLHGVPVIISGMVSSSIGMIELSYKDIPFNIKEANLNVHKILADEKFRHEILIVSGLKTKTDVMRGEETMLLGCEIKDDHEHLIIFPGTHSKHVILQNDIVKDFNTFMTGELFDLLVNKSVLASSVEKEKISENNIQSFIKGVLESASSNMLNKIFHVRANQLFGEMSKKENYHYLSGLLIGEEFKDIKKENFSAVTVVSNGILSSLYFEALCVMGLKEKLQLQNADEALIRGQIFIFKNINKFIL